MSCVSEFLYYFDFPKNLHIVGHKWQRERSDETYEYFMGVNLELCSLFVCETWSLLVQAIIYSYTVCGLASSKLASQVERYSI